MNLDNYPIPYLIIECAGEYPPQDYEEYIVSVKYVNPNNSDKSLSCKNVIMKKEKSLDFYESKRYTWRKNYEK